MRDLFGHSFGKLIALHPIAKKGKKRRWMCVCECGNRTTVPTNSLTSGETSSCGCKRKNRFLTHGKTHTKEYVVWSNIKSKCHKNLILILVHL